MQKIPELPKSEDSEFWQGENHSDRLTPLTICSTHTLDNWTDLSNRYIDNYDGTVSCSFCPWGKRLAGYYRCIDGKIVDLRNVNSK